MKKTYLISAIILAFSELAIAQTIVNTDPGPRVAILEEFTGVNCVGCPGGHHEIGSLFDTYSNGEFFSISYNPTNSSLTAPYNGATDFRRGFLDAFYAHAYCSPATETRFMPSGFINRKIGTDGDRLRASTDWETYATSVIQSGDSPMNIGLHSTYDQTAEVLTIDVEIYYHTDVTDGNSFYVFLGEHDLTSDYQSGASSSPYVYEFNIFRETVTTGTWGDEVTGPTTAGSLFSTQLTFDMADAIDPINISNLDVLAFIIEDQSTEIYTGIQVAADGGMASTGTITSAIGEQTQTSTTAYPNPFNTEFVIESDVPSAITVSNTVGEVVLARTINGRTSIDATSLSAGIYFVREEASGAVMKLVKN